MAHDVGAHRLLANRPPALPQGAASAAIANVGGIALRQLFDFDSGVLADRSVVSTFAGCSLVLEDGTGGTDRKRVVKIGASES